MSGIFSRFVVGGVVAVSMIVQITVLSRVAFSSHRCVLVAVLYTGMNCIPARNYYDNMFIKTCDVIFHFFIFTVH